MSLTREQISIMDHVIHHAAGGFYCGTSPDMRELVNLGFMESAGRKSFVPDEYFKITRAGRAALQDAQKLTITK